MKASTGDRIVIASATIDGVVRDGEVVAVPNADGSPPYRVRWSDTGQESLLLPGQDASISTKHPAGAPLPQEPSPAPPEDRVPTREHLPSPLWQHVRRWSVVVDVFEHEDDTTAHAVLTTDAPDTLDARGQAHRLREQVPVPEIGAEVAVARALHRLADGLMAEADEDLTTGPVR